MPGPRRSALPAFVLAGLGLLLGAAVVGRQAMAARSAPPRAPARKVQQGAALLGASVLVDSGMEHFRGGFHRPAMYAAPMTGALSIASSIAEPRSPAIARAKTAGHATSAAVGLAGLGFHASNVLLGDLRPSWDRLFYGAPLGAPGALLAAGALNLAADRLDRPQPDLPAPPGAGRLLGALAGLSLLAETAEVGLLHFRGAYQNRAMYLPVTIPPAAGALLIAQSARPRRHAPVTRALLRLTAVLGVVGTGFHVYGVHRNMGGWTNWRQNFFVGPPVPAPISFTGLALAGLGALDLIESREAAT